MLFRSIEERGWVNDTQFAQDWVEDRADRKGYGTRRLTLELQRKGIAQETIQETLSAQDPDAERQRALALAQKKWASRDENGDTAREKRRLTDYLLRRGFSYGVIRQVLTELSLEAEEE